MSINCYYKEKIHHILNKIFYVLRVKMAKEFKLTLHNPVSDLSWQRQNGAHVSVNEKKLLISLIMNVDIISF